MTIITIPSLRPVVLSAGLIPLLVGALAAAERIRAAAKIPEFSSLRAAAVQALTWLISCPRTDRIDAAVACAVVDAGAVPLLIAALGDAEESFASSAATVIRHLLAVRASAAGTVAAIVPAALPQLAAILRRRGESGMAARRGAEVLEALMKASGGSSIEPCIAAGCVPGLISILSVSGDPGTIGMAVHVLMFFITRPSGLESFRASGGVRCA